MAAHGPLLLSAVHSATEQALDRPADVTEKTLRDATKTLPSPRSICSDNRTNMTDRRAGLPRSGEALEHPEAWVARPLRLGH
jgi:hypothetical protein